MARYKKNIVTFHDTILKNHPELALQLRESVINKLSGLAGISKIKEQISIIYAYTGMTSIVMMYEFATTSKSKALVLDSVLT